MTYHFYKYQGAGNDFVMIDNRNNTFPKENNKLIKNLCDRRFGIGADGLILLENAPNYDFKMIYYNADGNQSTMCGNGGRCIVAFAKKLNIIKEKAHFIAIDGNHFANINNKIVNLQMANVKFNDVEIHANHTFLNTGSPHHVAFYKNIETLNVKELGKQIRYGAPYFEIGSNVNFAQQLSNNKFKVRTYERGVENETLACGTGVTAVAIAAHKTKKTNKNKIQLEAKGGVLEVSFKVKNQAYTEIFLKGSAKFVFEGKITL